MRQQEWVNLQRMGRPGVTTRICSIPASMIVELVGLENLHKDLLVKREISTDKKVLVLTVKIKE